MKSAIAGLTLLAVSLNPATPFSLSSAHPELVEGSKETGHTLRPTIQERVESGLEETLLNRSKTSTPLDAGLE